MQVANATAMAQQFLINRLPTAMVVVDATAGNGYDTLFLAQNTSQDAAIWTFDVQAAAIANTRKRLAENGYVDKVQLILDSHVNVAEYVTRPIDAAMFNLGYLPGADRSVTTLAQSTISALSRIAELLSPEGMLTIVAYPGHTAGQEENVAIASFLRTLPQGDYTVGYWSIINQKNNPPVLYIVEKRGDQR